MPLIHYLCECLYSTKKFYRQTKDVPPNVACKKCGKQSKKQLKAPSSASIISVDNGIQARAVEVNLDVIEDIQERSSKNFSEE